MSIIKFSFEDVKKCFNLPNKSFKVNKSKEDKVEKLILQFDELRKEYLSKQYELRLDYSDEFVSILQQLNKLGVDYNKIEEIDLDVVKLAMSKENSTE